MDTKDFWMGSFGDEYLKRNRVDWRARIPFWKDVIDRIGARSVFELGCNAGWNLSAINMAYPDVATYGEDVNESALDIANACGLNVCHVFNEEFRDNGPWELTFTAGVLIHIDPDNLEGTMQELINKSCNYVLAIEYESEQEEEVLYRGHEGKLWKRDYGKLYQSLGLTLVDKWDAGVGFDNCTSWLFTK